MYVSGLSIPEISEETGIPRSTVRSRLISEGVTLRSRSEAVRLSADQGKLGGGLRGKSRTFSDAHKSAIRSARNAWADANAVGLSIKPSGYVEITRGPNKGRRLHVVKMEERIGRRLREDENVHHIDGNRQNNDENNLALLTRSGHARLHRLLDAASGKKRERKPNGRFS